MHFSFSNKIKNILPERKTHHWAPKFSHNFASLNSKKIDLEGSSLLKEVANNKLNFTV